MSRIDKTRDNLKVESLDNNQRKELFTKFVKAGGQVVHEKRPKTIKIDRNKQRELQQRLDAHHAQAKIRPTESVQAFSRQNKPAQKQSDANGMHILFSRIRLFFMGVSSFSGIYFKRKFLELFKVEFNPAMIELQMIFLDLFKQKPIIGHQIVDQLDNLRPLYYELIEMTADIYSPAVSVQMIGKYSSMPTNKYHVFDNRVPVLEYFKRLYVLHQHVDLINFAFDRAIELQEKMERGKSSVYAAKRKKVKNSLYIIFNKMFPRLYWLFNLMQGEIIELTEIKRIDDILGIKSHMRPGTRTANQISSRFNDFKPEPKKEEKVEPAVEQKKAEPVLPDEVKKGFELMRTIDYKRLRNELITDDLLLSISDTDKIMTTYLLFLEFDREYSFVLTTYKIKFTPAYSIRGKSDYRMRLTDLYNKLRPCIDGLKLYFEAFDIYEKARADKPTSNDQYFKYAQHLTELERQKKTAGTTARNVIISVMDNLTDEFHTLIEDMDFKHEIVLNPQDLIEFDSALERDRKLNGKKVYECIILANAFASAFSYRLSPGGDLYGSSEQAQEAEVVESPKVESEVTDTESDNTSGQSSPQDTEKVDAGKKDKSILGELDDFL